MTRRSHDRPALPPKAKAEILEVLFANMEISGDEIAAIRRRIQNQAHGLNASAGKVRSRIAVLDRLIARLRRAA